MRTNIVIIGIFFVLVFWGRAYVDYRLSVEKTKREFLKTMPSLLLPPHEYKF